MCQDVVTADSVTQCDLEGKEDCTVKRRQVATITGVASKHQHNRSMAPSRQRYGVACAGKVAEVSIASKNLVRVTPSEVVQIITTALRVVGTHVARMSSRSQVVVNAGQGQSSKRHGTLELRTSGPVLGCEKRRKT